MHNNAHVACTEEDAEDDEDDDASFMSGDESGRIRPAMTERSGFTAYTGVTGAPGHIHISVILGLRICSLRTRA